MLCDKKRENKVETAIPNDAQRLLSELQRIATETSNFAAALEDRLENYIRPNEQKVNKAERVMDNYKSSYFNTLDTIIDSIRDSLKRLDALIENLEI